jgi:uncharacterized protein YdeI (YjbR/CyaY-like superfamily)
VAKQTQSLKGSIFIPEICFLVGIMEIGKTLYAANRAEWREWLAVNFDKEKEIWLILPGKQSGRPAILYNDAVEEALSFGWIDSTVKPFENSASAQRYTPRNPRSGYSQANIERLRWLAKEGKLQPSVSARVKDVINQEFVFPPDILKAVKANKQAWSNYQKYSPAYQRIRVAYIEGARDRPAEFQKRLENFINKTEQNKIFGFGGIEKYY